VYNNDGDGNSKLVGAKYLFGDSCPFVSA